MPNLCFLNLLLLYHFQIWHLQTDGPIFSSPSVLCDTRVFKHSSNVQPSTVIVGSHDSCVYCVAMETGHVTWKFQCDSTVYSSPFQCNMDFYRSEYEISKHTTNLESLSDAKDCNDRVSGTSKGAKRPLEDLEGNLSLDVVVCASTKGALYILDRETGQCLCEQQMGGEIFSSPVVLGRKVYVGCRNDAVYCLQLANT